MPCLKGSTRENELSMLASDFLFDFYYYCPVFVTILIFFGSSGPALGLKIFTLLIMVSSVAFAALFLAHLSFLNFVFLDF